MIIHDPTFIISSRNLNILVGHDSRWCSNGLYLKRKIYNRGNLSLTKPNKRSFD